MGGPEDQEEQDQRDDYHFPGALPCIRQQERKTEHQGQCGDCNPAGAEAPDAVAEDVEVVGHGPLPLLAASQRLADAAVIMRPADADAKADAGADALNETLARGTAEAGVEPGANIRI